MWIPEPQATAFYGAALPQLVCDLFPALLDGGDLGLVNVAGSVFAVMPQWTFETIVLGGGAA